MTPEGVGPRRRLAAPPLAKVCVCLPPRETTRCRRFDDAVSPGDEDTPPRRARHDASPSFCFPPLCPRHATSRPADDDDDDDAGGLRTPVVASSRRSRWFSCVDLVNAVSSVEAPAETAQTPPPPPP
mmetsp:Transcript_14941/g.59965  ORF Transcript_14941/g.59965 Transcript_14941/m.59965 type:complete len:127 (-) Transcript_14941:418-798(-)